MTLLSDRKISRKAGQHLEIQAQVKGHPQPKVTWCHNNQEVTSSSHVTVKTSEHVSEVHVTSPTGNESGNWRILATNDVGSDEIDVDVIIRDRPTPPVDLRVTEIGPDHVTLVWEPPVSDGGAEIECYVIEKKDASKLKFVSVATAESCSYKVNILPQ